MILRLYLHFGPPTWEVKNCNLNPSIIWWLNRQVDHAVTWFLCDNGCWDYNNQTVWLLLAACGTSYKPWPVLTQPNNVLDKHTIPTISETSQTILIHFQLPLVFWWQAVNIAVYHHLESPNDGLTKWADCHSCQVLYSSYMRHWTCLACPHPTSTSLKSPRMLCHTSFAIRLLRHSKYPPAATICKIPPKIN